MKGRGVSSGGGQSSLGYLFGSDESPKVPTQDDKESTSPPKESTLPSDEVLVEPAKSPPSALARAEQNGSIADVVPAGKLERNLNNYHRADGQNTGNFITDRPSTKVVSAPGGGSSLGYLFGGGN